MTNEELRDCLAKELAQSLRFYFQEHRDRLDKIHSAWLDVNGALNRIKQAGLTDEEVDSHMGIYTIQSIREEVNPLIESKEDFTPSEAVDYAFELINMVYDLKGKYDGRDASYFFHKIFERISDRSYLLRFRQLGG